MNILALALFLTLACPMSAQVPSTTHRSIPVRNPDSFVHLTAHPWLTFDPAAVLDTVSFLVTGNVYEPLITFKNLKTTDKFIPFLASEVPTTANGLLSADGTVYIFPIRRDIRFHDGQSLTPEDVRYSLLRFMLTDVEGGPSKLLLKPLLGVYGTRNPDGQITLDFSQAERAIQVESDKVILRLKQPSAHFLKILASLPIIISKAWAVEHGEWDGTEAAWKRYNNRPLSDSYLHEHMNGTGPFLLGPVEPKKQLALKRNEKYWRKPAKLSEVFLRVVPSKAMRLWMLENGDADSSYLESQDFAEASQISEVKIVDNLPSTALGQMLFFTFDTDPRSDFIGSGHLDGLGIPPDFFKDPWVRRGFAYAFDYDGYLKRGMGMRGKRAFSLVPDYFFAAEEKPRYSYDLEKAKTAFKKAFSGQLWEKGFTLTVGYDRNLSRQSIVDILRASLERINPKFNLRSQALVYAQLHGHIKKHQLPLFIAGYHADYPDPQAFVFGLAHSSGYFPQAQRYYNAKLDSLVERAEASMDPKKRRKLYLRICQMAISDLPHIYTCQPIRFKAGRDWVRGLEDDQNISNLNLNNLPYFYSFSKE